MNKERVNYKLHTQNISIMPMHYNIECKTCNNTVPHTENLSIQTRQGCYKINKSITCNNEHTTGSKI